MLCFFMRGLLFYRFFLCLATVWISSENDRFHLEVHAFFYFRTVTTLRSDKGEKHWFRWECLTFLHLLHYFCRRIELYEIIRVCVRCRSFRNQQDLKKQPEHEHHATNIHVICYFHESVAISITKIIFILEKHL